MLDAYCLFPPSRGGLPNALPEGAMKGDTIMR